MVQIFISQTVLVVSTLSWLVPLLTHVPVKGASMAYTAIITKTYPCSCMAGHHESFYHALPLVSSKESQWVELTFSDRLNTWGLLMPMPLFVCVSGRSKGKSERTEFFSPVVQLSAPIRIKHRAAESWCHGWPLQDQTCHFSYISVQGRSTDTHLYPFYQHPSIFYFLIHVPPASVYVPIRVCLLKGRYTLGSFLTNKERQVRAAGSRF